MEIGENPPKTSYPGHPHSSPFSRCTNSPWFRCIIYLLFSRAATDDGEGHDSKKLSEHFFQPQAATKSGIFVLLFSTRLTTKALAKVPLEQHPPVGETPHCRGLRTLPAAPPHPRATEREPAMATTSPW